MTEAKALALAIGCLLFVYSCVVFVLMSVDARVEALVLAHLAAICIGAYASSSIVMHYGAKRHDR